MLKPIKKYFIPSEENEYHPHFLRGAAVAVLSLVLVVSFFATVYRHIAFIKTDLLAAIIPKVLVDITNSDRAVYNVSPLQVSPILEQAALLKAQDMATYGYFAHVSPDGKSPWHWFSAVDYNYIYAGENLAVNFTESVDVSRAWMNSPTHRDNVLNDRFTEIGIATARGYYNGRETVFVVQMFGRPFPNITLAKENVSTPIEETVRGVVDDEVGVVDSTPEVSEPILISESETFIAVENTEAIKILEEAGIDIEEIKEETTLVTQSSALDRGLANPGRVLSFFYLFVALVVLMALILTVFIEVRKQHLAPAIFALVLIIIIAVLMFIYRNLFLMPVTVL